MKEHGKFLEYLFEEHTRCCTYGQAIRIRLSCVSIYPHSASNMSVNAVLSAMQCGYPRAIHVQPYHRWSQPQQEPASTKFVKRVTTGIGLLHSFV